MVVGDFLEKCITSSWWRQYYLELSDTVMKKQQSFRRCIIMLMISLIGKPMPVTSDHCVNNGFSASLEERHMDYALKF